MKATWIDRTVEIKDEEWDRFAKSGIYIVMRRKPIPRIGGKDRKGILYIGQAFDIAKRLDLFHYVGHKTSYAMYLQPKIAKLALKKQIKNEDDLYRTLGKLKVRIACPMNKKELDRAERACLFSYLERFGELPPFNANLPRSQKPKPMGNDLRWARKGIS